MRRVRKGILVAAAVLAATIFASGVCLGRIPGPRKGGRWPATWADQLEPYRKQAWTVEVTDLLPLVPKTRRPHGIHETLYKISFDTPEDFQKAWPAILKVKDKNAPLILERSPFYYPRLGKGIDTGVLILCPIGGQLMTGDGKIKFTDHWGTIARAYDGSFDKMPEYVVEDRDKWVAYDGAKGENLIFRARNKDFISEAQRKGPIFRVRTDIVLIADGKIADLNRTLFPADTLMIDNRFDEKPKAEKVVPAIEAETDETPTGRPADRNRELKPVATLRGLVSDEGGKPLEGVTVQVFGIENFRDDAWVRFLSTGRMPIYSTDEKGRFAVPFYTTNQRYDLWFDKPGFAPTFLRAVSAQSPEIEVALKRGIPLSGTVTRLVNGQRKPVILARVELRLPTWDLWYKQPATTGINGQYTLHICPPLPGYKWQVVFLDEAVQVDFEEDKPLPTVDFEVEVTAKKTVTPAAAAAIESTSRSTPEKLIEEIGAAVLRQDAERLRPSLAQSDDIPKKLWGDGIQKLNPVRVYRHRVNVVCVLQSDGDVESGLYIYVPISSYIPRSGDDGFTFTRIADDIYRFEKKKSN